jgi:hypothetical protein
MAYNNNIKNNIDKIRKELVMTDYDKMKKLFDELLIGYEEGEDEFGYDTIFVWYTNATFLFDVDGNFKIVTTSN